jgi:hypothetical protein
MHHSEIRILKKILLQVKRLTFARQVVKLAVLNGFPEFFLRKGFQSVDWLTSM